MMGAMNYRTEWNLGLLYKSEKDPQIEKDIKLIEVACADFEKKYKGKNFTSTSIKLFKALNDYELLKEKTAGNKPWWYFALRSDMNSDDSFAGAAATRIEQRLSKATNRLIFFSLEIGKIPQSKQKIYLRNKQLAPFAYGLERVFNRAKFNLTEQEEQLVDLLSQTSYTMWVDGQERNLTQQTIEYKGERLPLSKAIYILGDQSKNDRNILSDKINAILKSNSSFAEAEINAIYNYKKIMDERRGYKKPYSATVLGYENDEKTVETLVATVTKYMKISQRFYLLHAKLLGEKDLSMADRAVKIGKIKKKFDFNTTVAITKSVFARVNPQYAAFIDQFLEKGQFDVYPRKGKRNGAYCWGMGQLPTFVLLNHVDTIDSVETFAHEMGHAVHTELSKKQPPRYQKYSTATAEVASTFFEQLISEEIEQYLTDDEKIILLHNKIFGDVTTIFRQIACFNFELELHDHIRREGQLDKEKIAILLQKHLQSYVGPAIKVSEDDGYFYVTWSHIRRFFYVYSYAYGQLISKVLHQKWKSDHTYAKKIEQFLSAGRSMSPKDIFKKIGIVIDEKFFETGLQAINKDIDKLERLAKKIKKIQ